MEANLEKLLNKINIDQNKYNYFENGKLIKIIGNKEKTKYEFIIENNILPLEIYLEVSDLLKKTFNITESILIINSNNNDDNFVYYYRYFIEKYSENSPLLRMFLDSKLELNDKYNIILSNKAEVLKFNTIKEKLQKDLNNAGYKCEINVIIDGEEEKKIIEEIKEDLKVEVVEQPKVEVKEEKPSNKYKANYEPKPLIQDPNDEDVIVGKRIEESISRLDMLSLPGGSIVIEAYIFGKDVREAKSGLKIMSLKISDNTDSIYGTLFIRDPEEFKIIDKKIKVGNWYKIRAKVKDKDQYSQDISLLINDINVSKKVFEKIPLTLAEKKNILYLCNANQEGLVA